MYCRTFIIGFMLCGKVSFSQLGVSCIDSLNAKMLKKNYPIDLTKFGNARLELKDGTILSNCVITEIKEHWVIYKKRETLHDQAIDKIKVIRFDEHGFKLQFDEFDKGKLIKSYP